MSADPPPPIPPTDGEGPDDASLDLRLAAGDEDALGILFSRHQGRLRRMVDVRLAPSLRHRVDPDDVLQETFLAAHKRLSGFGRQAAMTGFVWLRFLAGQCLTETYRRHLGAQRRSTRGEIHISRSPAPTAHSESLSLQLTANMSSPSQVAMRAERVAELTAALDAMDELDREVLVLRHFEELTNGEVAALLGLQKQAASNRYIRALGRLRDLMSPPTP